MGYGILAARLEDNPDSIADGDAAEILATIEKDLQESPNWARYAMNAALISIGVFKPSLRQQVIEAAKRIGKVDVDHGETSCKTPDAVACIARAARRKPCP